MTTCARCGLGLAPGSAHVNEASCIEALKHALSCFSCKSPVPIVYCGPCAVKTAAKGMAGRSAPGIVNWLQGLASDPGAPGEASGGGRRFVP